VAEWLKAPVLKTGKLTLRGFESHPLRQVLFMITQSTQLQLQSGLFTVRYHRTSHGECVSVAHGDLAHGAPVVRLHASCLFGEAFGALGCDCAPQLASTLELIQQHGGVLVYRYAEGRGVGLEQKIQALELQHTRWLDTVEAFAAMGYEPDLRQYGAELEALADLGVSRTVKFASQNPRKLVALQAAGFEVVEQLHPAIEVTEYNRPELLTKKNKLGYSIKVV
jgi:3,4-dihydroxy 2-butanone 4-phosphate synthase / GTP cyclohydrolase II